MQWPTNLIVIALLGLSGTATAQVPLPLPSTEQPAASATVVVPEGQFVFSNLKFSTRLASPGLTDVYLEGDVTNLTSKAWIEARFILKLYGGAGRLMRNEHTGGDFPLTIIGLSQGGTQKLSEWQDRGWTVLQGGQPIWVSKHEIAWAGGEYPASYRIVMVKPTISPSTSYQDTLISVAFNITKKEIDFALQNKSESPIKIDWNQVAYVDVTGKSHRVLHEGVRLIDRDKPLAPTIVPPTARIEDLIYPTDYAEWTGNAWHQRLTFPEGPAAKDYKGASFSVFMPLDIDGKTHNYLFTFKIQDVML